MMKLGKIRISCMIHCQINFWEIQAVHVFLFQSIPSFKFLFELFWTAAILNDIVEETNAYARGGGTAAGSTMGGPNWEEFTVPGLKAFMAMAVLMGMKKQPNYKTYWMKDSFFHCDMISNIFMEL